MLYLCHEVSIGYVVHVVAYSCAYGEYSDDFLYHWQEQDPKNRVLYFVQTNEFDSTEKFKLNELTD